MICCEAPQEYSPFGATLVPLGSKNDGPDLRKKQVHSWFFPETESCRDLHRVDLFKAFEAVSLSDSTGVSSITLCTFKS